MSSACAFIVTTKLRTVPLTRWASAIAASLPLGSSSPLSSVSSLTRLPRGSTPTPDPLYASASLVTRTFAEAAARATNGVTEQVMTTAMVVSGTTTVDAAATTARQLTGYGTDGPNNAYVVLYEVPNATTYFSAVKRGQRLGGVVTTATLAPSFCIASRAFQYGSAYYFVGAYDSTVQPGFSLLEATPLSMPYPVVQCQIMPG